MLLIMLTIMLTIMLLKGAVCYLQKIFSIVNRADYKIFLTIPSF